MKKCPIAALLGLLVLSNVCLAQSLFNGTWRPEPHKLNPQSNDVFVLADGIYECKSCDPPVAVKADGLDHPISGNSRYNSISVLIIDDRAVVKTVKKEGEIVATSEVVISVDGATMMETHTLSGVLPQPVQMASRSTRVSAGPAGSHLISGEWRLVDAYLKNHEEDITYKVGANSFSMSDRAGRSFFARLDGSESHYFGDPRFTSVSVELIDSRTIKEIDKNQDRIILTALWSIDIDGKTMHVRSDSANFVEEEQTLHKLE